jgi:outer membrane protein TolC
MERRQVLTLGGFEIMARKTPRKSGFLFFLTVLPIAIAGIGCSPSQYKEQADKQVYQIIDKKWQDDYGPRVNYRISDVAKDPNDINAALAVPPSGRLTLAEAVAIATAHNRDYQTQKEQLYLAALDLTGEMHVFEPQFFGNFGGDYIHGPDDETVGLNGDVGFSQLMADGTKVTAGIAGEWLRYLTGDPDTSLGSVLSAVVTKPLLRGSNQKIVQENLTQAQRDTLYQIRAFNHYRKNFVITIISAYYRVLQNLDNVKNAENNYKNLEITMDRTKYQAQAGRIARFEVDQVEQQLLSAGDQQLQAEQAYQQSLDEFKILLSMPTDAPVELVYDELKTLKGGAMSNPEFTVEDAIVASLELRLDLANSRDQVDDAGRKVDVAIDNLRADLKLVGSANVASRPNTHMTELQFHKGNYDLGFDLNLPLDRLNERNAYRQAVIQWSRQQRKYDLDRDQVKLDVRRSYRDLIKNAESYQIQLKSLRLAEKRFESTSLLQQAGRATTRDVLESQSSLLSAQNDATAALVGHTIAKMILFRDVGVLQVRPDGLWEQKPWTNQSRSENVNDIGR